MSDPVLNRAYLKNLPAITKQNQLNQIVNTIVPLVQAAARNEKTSYLMDITSIITPVNMSIPNIHGVLPKPTSVVTQSELLTALTAKFPDCTITYKETEQLINPTTKTTKKGFLIDWS
jgi:hypothetical protein